MSDVSASTRTPNPFLAAAGRALEAALNRVVDLDPDTRTRLRAFDGQALTVDLEGSALALRVAVQGDRLRIGPAFAAPSALRVAATPGALLALVFARNRDDALPPGRIEIAGDAELARRLERLATRFAPDFDAAFTRVFGDVPGFQIARSLRRALARVRESAQALAQDTAEFLAEEGCDLVSKAELDGFLDEVDSLRERGDRLGARVQRLRAARMRPA